MGTNSPPPPEDAGGAAYPRNARQRILETAYALFSRHGIRNVGIDAVIGQSGVARMTLYRHFKSKNDLVLAFLERREQLWTNEWLRVEVERRAVDPGERLLAIFDLFDEWFQRPDFEGCAFVNVLLETSGNDALLRDASAAHLANIRQFIEALASEADVADTDAFARKWHILMKGSIVAAMEGDRDAARRAREIAAAILQQTLQG